MSTDMWVQAIGLMVAGLTIAVVGHLGAVGRLPRNPWAGIRVKATMRSDEAWRAAHQAGGLLFELGGVAALAAGMSIVATAGSVRPTMISFVAMFVVLALIIVASARGVRAANEVNEREDESGAGQED